MQIDLSPILRGEVCRMEFEFELSSPEDFGGVHFPKTITVSGYVNDAAGYMTLVAESEITLSTNCARCANEIHPVHFLHIERTLALKLEDEDNDDYVLIKANKVDLDEEIREELVLGLAYTYYCKEDCKGLCAKCGKNLNEGDCSCANIKEIDPRLANLSKLLDN